MNGLKPIKIPSAKEKVDIFVAGVGTGGTLSGVAEGLKKQNPHIQIVAILGIWKPNRVIISQWLVKPKENKSGM